MSNVTALLDCLRECADDLAAELDARHSHRVRYPSIMRDWQRDMTPVVRARALLAEWSERLTSCDSDRR
jgi:hypothetical protein